MKRVLAIILAGSLAAAPYTAAVSAKNAPSAPPPIEQPLVREGEFAVELAAALNLTSSQEEASAERDLISVEIAPRNGWISDYPMTPDIIAEVRDSAAASASSGRLQISKTDAAGIVDKVSIAMNLPVKAAGEKYSSESGSEYVERSAVEDYYSEKEPPVVTYYPPPWEYADMYDWVPDPFWWGGFGFGGFFILVDFDRRHHKHRVTNHVVNGNGAVSRINAVARARTGATVNRQTGSVANTASGFARDADRSSGVRDTDRFSSSPRLNSSSRSTGGGNRGWSGGGFRGGGSMGGFPSGGGHR